MRLELNGFTVFREGELELAGLSRFAIVGATGAGKTSLLDAIIFALYGAIPRMGKQGLSEFISLGRDRMAVTLEFEVDGHAYRVVRTQHRNRASQVKLEQDGRPVAGSVKEVAEVIERIIGLNYEAFTQAVVLPQGEFARFLKSNPKDRRGLLINLLRLQIYDRMRKLASELESESKSRLAGLSQRLSEDFGDAVPEVQARVQAELAEQKALELALESQLKTSRQSHEQLAARREKTLELEQARAREAKLRDAAREVDVQRAQLEAGRRAAPVLPRLEGADNAEKQAAEGTTRTRKTRGRLERLQTSVEQANANLDQAKKQSQRVEGLRERQSRLDKVMGLLKPRDQASEALAEHESQVEALSRQQETLQCKQPQLADQVAELEEKLVQAEEKLHASGYSETREEELIPLQDQAQELVRTRRDLARETSEIEAHEQRVIAAQRELERVQSLHRGFELELEESSAFLQSAEANLRAAEQQQSALTLRACLKSGEPCPVCEQTVAKLPAEGEQPVLNGLKRAVQDAKDALQLARNCCDESQKTVQRATHGVETRQAEVSKARLQVQRLTEAAAEQEARLGMDPEAVLQELKALQEARKQHKEHQTRVQAADKALRKVQQQLRDLEAELIAVEGGLATAQAGVERRRKELHEYQRDISAVTAEEDVAGERDRVVAEIKRLDNELNSAQEALQKLTREQASLNAQLAAEEAQAEHLGKEAERCRREASEALQAAGFASGEEARAASLASTRMEALDKAIREHEGSIAGVREQIEKLSGLELVTAEQLTEAETQVARQEGAHRDCRDRVIELNKELEQLAERIERAKELVAQQAKQVAQYDIYRRLNRDLGSEHFQQFLLDEVFRDLVAGASHRLAQLCRGDYSLEYEDNEFRVVDHVNASERRSAETLSGGETFLASLALALELSEQVQRASGAVRLDSLFIDEGFGTLDPETLDTVTQALETLEAGGRTVGIITHIRELSERLPARILVTKSEQGSRVEVVTE
ncbi:MAG: SMC family ATPase [Candidatus Eremiobacterota bacterium]